MNQDKDFAMGDVVRLKSGGPRMTITGFSSGSAVCSWFRDNELVPQEVFKREALIHAANPANDGDGRRLAAGDVVRLKSGGPLMTIAEIIDGNAAHCLWIVDGNLFKNRFAWDLSVLVSAPPPGNYDEFDR